MNQTLGDCWENIIILCARPYQASLRADFTIVEEFKGERKR